MMTIIAYGTDILCCCALPASRISFRSHPPITSRAGTKVGGGGVDHFVDFELLDVDHTIDGLWQPV